MIRVGDTRLGVMMGHPLVHLPCYDGRVGHDFVVIQLPVCLLLDAFRDKAVESDKSFGFAAMTLPIIPSLQTNRIEKC